MDEKLLQLIRTTVNSRAKLDVLDYFHRNRYAWESLTGLATRLHRTPADLEPAVHELAREGLLVAQACRLPAEELVYSYDADGPAGVAVAEVMAAYESHERKAILRAVMQCDDESRTRALESRRVLDDARTRFVSMVTHELRTPITIVRAVLSTLASGKIDQEQAAALLQRGVSQCDRLTTLIENVLVLSGLQTGRKLELYLAEVQLPRLLAELPERVGIAEKHRFEVVLHEAPETIVADEYLLGQMLEELVDNAVKFSPDGGCVRVCVTQQGEQAVFTVEDEGIGMSQPQIEQVFERFYQAEQDASRLPGGLGVGLFLCRTIAEAHGGAIWLEAGTRGGVRAGVKVPVAGPASLPLI